MEDMKAARFVEVGRMEFERVPVPELAAGELLVRTEMASICGSDLHVVYHGTFRTTFPQNPGYPGHEGIGEVVESRHPDFKAGELVLTCPDPFNSKAFAEYQAIPGEYCLKLPDYDGPRAHLLMAQQLGTVIFALRQNPVDVLGRNVVVMGQGSAGLFFAYLIKRAGAAQVIVSDLSEARLAASRQMGATVAVKAGGDNLKDAVMAHTGGLGADYLVEAVGGQASLLESVSLAREGANMLMFGLPDTLEPVDINFHDFFRKKLLMSTTYGAQEEEGRVSFRMALDLIANKQIDVSPLLSHVFPIEEIDEAMRTAHERTGNALKVSVTF